MASRTSSSPAVRARQIAPVLKALSDENRLTILLAVADRESSVTELVATTGLGQTLVSHHLKSLRDAGLVTATPVGRSNVYALCCEAMAEPIALLATLARANDCPTEPPA
ncbi:MAG: metalloregulator ArsR/SmtB family transcription factor [Nocardioides sp.]|nr:metalloregulator ArsR/SmtB family transcription factor [Nocardioides sp.]